MNPRLARILAGALFVRIIVAATPGFPDDRILFVRWARILAAHGPLAIYAPSVSPAVDYPPGLLYLFWAIGAIHATFGGGEIAWRVLLEIVPIAGDLTLIVMLYALAREIADEGRALLLASALAFAAPLWIDSAAWGQADSVPIALAIAALIAALRSRMDGGLPLLAIGVIIKPLVVVLGPIVVFIHQRAWSIGRIAVGIGASLVLAYITTLPFTLERSPIGVLRFLLSRYVAGTGKAPFVTEGAFSVYPLVTNFFTPDTTRFGPFTYHGWAVGFVLVALAWIIIPLLRSSALRADDRTRTLATFAAASLTMLALFLFATRMHERYLLPALIIGAPLTLDDRPTALALAYLALSFTINCAYSLAHFTGGAHHPQTLIVGRLFCALNLVAFAVLSQRYTLRLQKA